MLEEIAKLIENKDFAAVEDRWMEMMETAHPVDQFVTIAQALKKAGAPDKALMLMELLLEGLESNHDFTSAIEACKNTIYFVGDDKKLRTRIAGLYKKAHPHSVNLDKYIEAASLSKSDSFLKSLQKLDEFMFFDIGRYFYFDNYGLGNVTDVIILKHEIAFNFEKKGKHFLAMDVAKKLLTPVPPESFLYKRAKAPQELKQTASDNPEALVLLIIKSMNSALTPGQVKSYLETVVDKDQAAHIWEKSRKQVEANRNVRVAGKAQKTYEYVAGGIDKDDEALSAFDRADLRGKYDIAEEYARKNPQLFAKVIPDLARAVNQAWEKQPALALDVALLFDRHGVSSHLAFSIEAILEKNNPEQIVLDLVNAGHQRRLLDLIKTRHAQDWPSVFAKLLLAGKEPTIYGEIEKALNSHPEVLRSAFQNVFMVPMQHQPQYQWLLKKMSKGELAEYLTPAYASKLIGSLDQIKGIRALVLKILNLTDFDQLTDRATPEEAGRLLAAIDASDMLAENEKKDFRRIIEHHFPQLFPKDKVIIYSSKEALARKREELRHILDVDIPENKKDISRAREFGDLSENFEYKTAKERQDQLYQKVRDMEAALAEVQVLELDRVDTTRVSVGTRVTLKDTNSGTETAYTILGRWDTDLEKNVISNEAPLAKSLLGKTVGQKVRLNEVEYEIRGIERAG